MKVTQEMKIDFWKGAAWPGPGDLDVRRGLEAVLRDVPEVQPFTFPGDSSNHVTVLHPPCGTVESYDPAMIGEGSMARAIAEGLCDCENTGPWLRVYVPVQS